MEQNTKKWKKREEGRKSKKEVKEKGVDNEKRQR